MPVFDAERHLRLAGERALLDGELHARGPFGSPLSDAAAALLAVEAIDRERAEAVVEEYRLAVAVRMREGGMRPGARISRPMTGVPIGHSSTVFGGGPAPAALAPRRLIPCDRHLETATAHIHVRYASLSAEATVLGVRLELSAGSSGRPMFATRAGVPLRPGGPPTVTLRDDRGTRASAHFAGAGDGRAMHGTLAAHTPLAADTAWIELDGERIELDEAVVPPPVALEALPDEPPALRHLWHLLAGNGGLRGPTPDLDPIIETLVAAGTLAVDDPALDGVRAVRDALHFTPGQPAGAAVPEPWRSLLARQGATDGRTFSMLIGAATPPIAGVAVVAVELESREEGFDLEVHTVPGIVYPREPAVLRWWAADDLGNQYLGNIGRWSGSEQGGSGQVAFWPALHPRASRLRLMPTGPSERAVVEVTLP
ncbi:MAG TPA: hypothetical protein VHX88_14210 [Solirubrobacteraceae bacterium]|jgi:hypothetical protein|nr:hypothetical protein [Solirubrobacteraceae bacterium]